VVAPSHLKSLQALELALRTGSLKGAAGVLAITPAAVGQRIKALEEYLGMELLVRGRAGLRAAPALANVLPHLSSAFRELENVSALLDMQRGHEVHLAAPTDFVELWLRPRLRRFTDGYPNVSFCINGEGAAPLRLGPVDCEFRFGPSREPGVVDALFNDFVLPIGAPENTARIASITRRSRLAGFPLLHLDFYKDDSVVPGWPEWIRFHRLQRPEPNRGIRYKRIATVVDAVLANAGFALCGLALVQPLIESGQLLLPFPVSTGIWTSQAFQARFRQEALLRPQVRRFRDWLAVESDATRQWLSRQASPARPVPKPIRKA
jgi:LysR family glycine cleavage system transcriptional activator